MSAVIRHLNIAINGKPIVDDVDLDIADGTAWQTHRCPLKFD